MADLHAATFLFPLRRIGKAGLLLSVAAVRTSSGGGHGRERAVMQALSGRPRRWSRCLQHVFGAEGLVAAVLGLEDDGGLDYGEVVPGTGGDVDPISAFIAVEPEACGLAARVVVEHHVYLAAQQNLAFGSATVAVYGQDGSGLQGIQHSLGAVVRGVAQVAVHPQPRRRLRL